MVLFDIIEQFHKAFLDSKDMWCEFWRIKWTCKLRDFLDRLSGFDTHADFFTILFSVEDFQYVHYFASTIIKY